MSKRTLRENAHLKIKRLQEENWKLHATIREQAAEIKRLEQREAGEIRYVDRFPRFTSLDQIAQAVGVGIPPGSAGRFHALGDGALSDEMVVEMAAPEVENQRHGEEYGDLGLPQEET